MQAYSDTFESAAIECVKNWDISDPMSGFNEEEKVLILRELKEEKVIPLSNTKNVWFGGIELHRKLMIMNLIKTENDI